MARVDIVRATASDAGLIIDLARRIWLAHYPGIITHRQIDYMLERDYASEAIINDLDRGVRFDLLSIDGVPVGFSAFGEGRQEKHAKLHKLYLDPSFHGRGHGSTLLRHVIDSARQCGFTMLTLQVNKHNPVAIRAYERAGFTRTQSILDAIGDGFFMDDYVMSLAL